MVALLIIPLLILAGIAIDLSLLVNERRDAQIAADHAALAAAWASCHDQNPELKGHELGQANGFPRVLITEEDEREYKALVSSTMDTAFGPLIGIDTLTTEAEAVAECKDVYDGIPAMFAGDGSCNPALDWSGNGGEAVGDVHTNGDLDVTGHLNTVTGEATYAGDDKITPGNQNTIDSTQGEEEPFPELGVAIEDYMPPSVVGGAGGVKWAEATAAGVNRNPSGVGPITIGNGGPFRPGLYYTTGNIRINRNNATPNPAGGVTFVSNGGTIEFIGSGQNLTPWDAERHILAFATLGDCDNPVMQLRGSDGNWNGIFFAPNGQIQIAGSNNGSTVAGSLIAATIDLQGSDFFVDATELQGEPTLTVRITK